MLLQNVEENPILKERIKSLEETVKNKDQQIANIGKELEIQKKLTELAEKEAAVERQAYEREKELTDKALKLAEIGKPKNIWETYGPLAIIAIIIVTIAHVL